MKSITLGLALSLLGGVALAQTPPASPPPALKQPAAGPAPTPPASQPPAPATPPAPQGQQNAQNGQPAIPTPSGPSEGMIVETPNGFYLVRPGDPNAQRLDLGRNGGGQPEMGQQGRGRMGQGQMGMGQPGMDRPLMGQNGPAAMTEGDDTMGDMAEDGMQPPPPRPHRGPPPPPQEGKGARFRIRTPNLTLGMKCPDDEPIKACVDAISQLMDKADTQAH